MVMTIIVILASMLLPALQQARGKAKHARWLGIKRSCQFDPNCMGYWTFERDTFYDSDGNGSLDKVKNLAQGTSDKYLKPRKLDGILNFDGLGGLVLGGGRFPGKSCLRFDGDDYVDLSNYSGLDCKGAMTLEAWVKLNTCAGNNYHIIGSSACCEDSSAPNYCTLGINGGYHLRLYNMQWWGGTSEEIKVGFEAGGKDYWCNNPANDAPILNDNTWHHIAVTVTTNGYTTYHDGNIVESVPESLNILPHKGNYSIGRELSSPHCGGGGEGLDGLIDEVAVYNRALTADEVKQHYRMGKP